MTGVQTCALPILSLLFPALAPLVRWMPVTLYLRACQGRWGDALALAALAGLILSLLWVLEQRRPAKAERG